jgi:hypothetical protein
MRPENPVTIEIAPSRMATCTGCGQRISKGELRMKEVMFIHDADPSDFDEVDFYHLPHAAKRRPRELTNALANFKDEVPDRVQLLSVATQRIEELDAFLNNKKWHTNDRGNRVLSGAGWKLTVFEKEDDWNWAITGDPAVVFATLAGEKPGEASATSKGNPESQFGPGRFPTQSDATDNLWLFLRRSATRAAS